MLMLICPRPKACGSSLEHTEQVELFDGFLKLSDARVILGSSARVYGLAGELDAFAEQLGTMVDANAVLGTGS